MRSARWTKAAACVAAWGCVHCSDTAAPRAQLLVVIDTDAHVVGELVSRPEVSNDAAIDTLEVEILDDQNQLVDARTFLVAETASWPLSFGIEPSTRFGSEIRISIRAFRALFASSGLDETGAATLDSPPEVTIARLVAVPVPTSGLQQVHLTLQYDCLGVPSSFGSPLQTCLDKDHLSGDPHETFDNAGTVAASRVGTWAPAIEVPCKSAPSPGRVCIPGGFFVLGDLEAVGTVAAGDSARSETVPLRPVIVSHFWLDEDEFTVGRFRTLVNEGRFSGSMPTTKNPNDPNNQFCTWLGPDDGSNDALPLNCVAYESSVRLCKGLLPTEAQWEYAARGRGERRSYPWGDAEPRCCSASLSRVGPPDIGVTCPGVGIEPAGSHPISSTCIAFDPSGASQPTGDVTRDGVYDMAGSMSEVLADSLESFSAPCWNKAAILRDPSCIAKNAAHALRGSYWNAGIDTALLSLRTSASSSAVPDEGFRCAYKDGAP